MTTSNAAVYPTFFSYCPAGMATSCTFATASTFDTDGLAAEGELKGLAGLVHGSVGGRS